MCFEYLRYLWDDADSDLTIVFTGGNGCFEMLQSEPTLESRVYAWQEIDRMPLDEVLAVVPACHPIWADAGPDLIALCDQEAARGNFRAWAKITHHLTVGMKESGRQTGGCTDAPTRHPTPRRPSTGGSRDECHPATVCVNSSPTPGIGAVPVARQRKAVDGRLLTSAEHRAVPLTDIGTCRGSVDPLRDLLSRA
ncbi:hypothetical protein ACYTFC_00005 [Streptomyces globosus]